MRGKQVADSRQAAIPSVPAAADASRSTATAA
jgi:hypothetical protein